MTFFFNNNSPEDNAVNQEMYSIREAHGCNACQHDGSRVKKRCMINEAPGYGGFCYQWDFDLEFSGHIELNKTTTGEAGDKSS